MRVAFFYEFGAKKEIGTGHKYRSLNIQNRLVRLGHSIVDIDDNPDVLVVDHVFSQAELIRKAKSAGTKVVLIDGAEEDVELVDLSISAFYNAKSQHRGIRYIIIPKSYDWSRYNSDTKYNTVFVGMGGFDANNIAERVIKILAEFGLNALVAKSINHDDLKQRFSNVGIFEEDDYYTAFKECKFAITNGGLTLFQALHFGIPTVAIPQYDHQKNNISAVDMCCESVSLEDESGLRSIIDRFSNSESYRHSISLLSQKIVDGKGLERACSLIEKVCG